MQQFLAPQAMRAEPAPVGRLDRGDAGPARKTAAAGTDRNEAQDFLDLVDPREVTESGDLPVGFVPANGAAPPPFQGFPKPSSPYVAAGNPPGTEATKIIPETGPRPDTSSRTKATPDALVTISSDVQKGDSPGDVEASGGVKPQPDLPAHGTRPGAAATIAAPENPGASHLRAALAAAYGQRGSARDKDAGPPAGSPAESSASAVLSAPRQHAERPSPPITATVREAPAVAPVPDGTPDPLAETATGAGRPQNSVAGSAPSLPQPAEIPRPPIAGPPLGLAATGPEVETASDSDLTAPTSHTDTRFDTVARPEATPAAARPQLLREAVPQILESIRANAPGDVELTLNPEELGRIRMSMTLGDGVLHLTIQSDRAETGELLRRHIALLRDELASLGYGQVDIGFGARSDSAGGGPFAASTDAHTEQRSDQGDAPQSATTSDTAPGMVPGRLDRRV